MEHFLVLDFNPFGLSDATEEETKFNVFFGVLACGLEDLVFMFDELFIGDPAALIFFNESGDESATFFVEQGLVFVATNYRLLPHVEMDVLVRDVARAVGWVHRHIAGHGGDPRRIFLMGHSAGAQLAALLCTDERYLAAEGVPFTALAGCVPVDGDTFDLPPIIATAEMRAMLYGQPLPTFGHRQKFGNDPRKHVDFSAVTHVAKGKDIPPFLILHVAGHPDTTAQAQRLAAVLEGAGVSTKVHAGRETTHVKINADLGMPGDPATQDLAAFLDECLKRR